MDSKKKNNSGVSSQSRKKAAPTDKADAKTISNEKPAGGSNAGAKLKGEKSKKAIEDKIPEIPVGRNKSTVGKSPRRKRQHKKKVRPPLELNSDEEKIDGGTCHSRMYGRQIEDVDPSMFMENTFCVVTKKFNKHYICRFSGDESVYLFPPTSCIRKLAIYLVTHRYFNNFIVFTILCNCATLAMSINQFDTDGEKIHFKHDAETDLLEFVFLGVYITEMILKIIAKGFVMNKFSYMRNSWNIVDFIVVCSGIITTCFTLLGLEETSNDDKEGIKGSLLGMLQLLRIFRVLRALKTVSMLPGLRTMTNALLSGARQLLEVMALNCSVLLIFNLFSMQMYMGHLRQKCVAQHSGPADPGTQIWDYSINQEKMWYMWVNNPDHWAQRNPAYPKDEYQPCANDTFARTCNKGYICLAVGQNFDDGWSGYDSFGLSLLSTFQTLSTDFWERPYELVLSTIGPWSLFFFLIILFFGSFYLLNLMLAVVAMSYETEAAKKRLASVSKSEKLHLNRASSTFSFDDPMQLNIKLLPEYRNVVTENFEDETLDKENSNMMTQLDSFTSIMPNISKGRFGDTIMGILGRRLTETDKFGSFSSTIDATAKEKDVAIEIDETHKKVEIVKTKDDSGSESEAGTVLVHLREDSTNDTYPSHPFRCRNLGSRTRQIAIALRRKLRPAVSHPMFDACMTFFIIVNTLFFALEHHGMAAAMSDVLAGSNVFFMAVFTVELVLKLLALQKEYFEVKWNIFDFFVVAVSYLDIVLPNDTTYLQSMRLLRIFKLAQSWITMKVLLNIIFSTLGALGNLVLLLTIVIYVFAILGMQVVGEEYSPANFDSVNNMEKFPRWNFGSFAFAFMVVFRVICGEWIELMWECFTAHKAGGEYWKCFAFFFPTLIIGNYMVLNLFLALLLESFSTEDLKAAKEREMEASGKAQNLKKIVILLMVKNDNDSKSMGGKSWFAPTTKSGTGMAANQKSTLGVEKELLPPPLPESLARVRFKTAAKRVMIKNRVALAERRLEEIENATDKKSSPICEHGHIQCRSHSGSGGSLDDKLLGPCIPTYCTGLNCALCIKFNQMEFVNWNIFRRGATKIVSHSSFEWTVLSFIFLSSITLCFEDIHLESRPLLKEILFYLNLIFCVIFIVEMLIKWVAFGLWGYFSNPWCILDFLIVVISLITLYFDLQLRFEFTTGHPSKSYRSNLASLKALRTLRALRPLRAISRWEGMKIVVNALMYAIPLIFNVFLVCLLFWLIFSIMGVQLYKGTFFKCVDPDGERISNVVTPTKDRCCSQAATHNYSWVNQVPNFDNVLQGYLSLFQMATFEGWMELMGAGIDAIGVDLQPEREYNPYNYIFFVIFIVFGAFFTLNLSIGVMVDNFGMLKKKYEGNLIEILLTPSQRYYLTALKKIGQTKPRKVIKRPNNKFLCIFYDLATCRRFEIAVFIVIFFNLLFIAFEISGDHKMREDILTAFNAFFTALYILECFIKIFGLRQFYFKQGWNIFDFILVISSLVDLLLSNNKSFEFPIPPTMLRVVRVIRIGRLLRLVKSAKGIRKLLNALLVSLPALGNIGALIALITFIYAILGMASFSGSPKFDAVDQVVNWDTFLNSCVVLLRLMLAAGWNDILDALLPAPLECGSFRKMKCGQNGEPDCPNSAIAIGYFVTYILIVFLIVINMYTAIILENYEEACHEEEGGINDDDLESFYTRWSRYDPQATQFIPFEQLSDFLASLDPPLYCRKPNVVSIVAFNLPICRGNKIHCLDLIHALVKRVVGSIDENEEFLKLQERMERKFHRMYPNRKLLDIISSTRVWKLQLNAAITIQRAWRAYYKRMHPDGKLVKK